jgi:glycolate oxidase
MKLVKSLEALEGIAGDLTQSPGINIEALLGNIRLVLPEKLTVADKEALAVKINALAMAHGGSVAGCLGTRLGCTAYRDAQMWEAITGVLHAVRAEFDPKGVLAPGVTFA